MGFSHAILSVLLVALTVSNVLALEIPTNLKAFSNRVKDGQCTGGEILKTGFYDKTGGSKTFAYCQDHETGVLYLHGHNSLLANMDIDCDGDQSDPGDGRCGKSQDTQSQTAFKDTVQKYSKKTDNPVSDLNANFIPYVVFGNYGKKKGYTTFHPEDVGLQPLSVIAVVCGDKLVYGVWGDTNGDDGPPIVGEASLSLATKCFGKSMNGNNGHDPADVLYIAFPGTLLETVKQHANWGANNFDTFESSIKDVGEKLVSKL